MCENIVWLGDHDILRILVSKLLTYGAILCRKNNVYTNDIDNNVIHSHSHILRMGVTQCATLESQKLN